MGTQVAPVDDCAGVLGRVQGSLRRSDWFRFRRALDTACALPIMGFYRSDPLSSRAGTHASCIEKFEHFRARRERRNTPEFGLKTGRPRA